MSTQYIRKIIKEFDDKLLHEDLQKKNSLILYREYKHVIHDEQHLYDNSAATTTLARTGTLKLINIERRHTDGYTNCEISKANRTEDIEHFLLDCEALTSTIAEFLLFNNKNNQNIIIRNGRDWEICYFSAIIFFTGDCLPVSWLTNDMLQKNTFHWRIYCIFQRFT